MSWPEAEDPSLAAAIWAELSRACGQMDHPFRTPALATYGPSPGVRTVVLRAVDVNARTLMFHSDARAGKVRDVQSGAPVEWLFYDPAGKVQVRARCRQAETRQCEPSLRPVWERLSPAQRLNYATPLPPGAVLPEGQDAFPSEVTDDAFNRFTVVTTAVDSFDWLRLRPDGRHERVRFQFDPGRGIYVRIRIVP